MDIIFYQINHYENIFRNKHMFKVIAKDILSGQRLFAVAGYVHVGQVYPAFLCLKKKLAEKIPMIDKVIK